VRSFCCRRQFVTALIVLGLIPPSASQLLGQQATDTLAPHILTVDAPPRGYLVLEIAVPSMIRGAAAAGVQLSPEPGLRLLGPREQHWQYDAPSTLLVTVSPSAMLPAGRQRLLRAAFVLGTDTVALVDVEAAVARVRSMPVAWESSTVISRPGERLAVRVRVRNEGNASDSVSLVVKTPEGWRMPETPSLALSMGEESWVLVALPVPTTVLPGEYPIMARATNGSDIEATGVLRVQVPSTGALPPGESAARVTLSSASTLLDGESVVSVLSADISGRIVGGPSIDARLVVAPPLSAGAQQGLSRSGVLTGLNYVRLLDRNWSATVGPVAMPGIGLTSFGAFGQGFAGSYQTGAWELAAGIARSPSFIGGDARFGREPLAGMRIARRMGPGSSIAFGASHLRTDALAGRSLDAVGIEYTRRTLGTDLVGSTALRTTPNGTTIGTSFSGRHEFAEHTVGLRGEFTPGGSEVFARAERTLQGDATLFRRSSRPIDVSAHELTDDGFGRQLVLRGASIGPRLVLRGGRTLSAGLALNMAEVRTATLLTGTTDRNAFVGLSGTVGRLLINGTIRGGSVAQELGVDETTVTATVGRVGARVNASTVLPWGRLAAQGSYDRVGAGAGFAPRTAVVGAQITELGVGPFAQYVRGSIEMFRSSISGFAEPLTTVALGAAIVVSRDTRILLRAESNRAVVTDRARAPWIASIRLSHGLNVRLPERQISAGDRALVYQDLNGNGRRDAEEPGMPGVGLRVGSTTVQSDGQGQVLLAGLRGGRPTVDMRTLPTGWLVGASSQASSRQQLEYGLVPAALVRVAVRFPSDVLGRSVRVPADRLVIVAVDDGGREWFALVDTDYGARLGGLPLGRYRVRVTAPRGGVDADLTRAEATIVLEAGRSPDVVSIDVLPRPVRIWVPGGQGGQSGQGSGGPGGMQPPRLDAADRSDVPRGQR